MEETDLTVSKDCSQCKFSLAAESVFCSNCGYPENGTVKEQSIFLVNKSRKKHRETIANSKIRTARNTLFVIAAINIIAGLVLFMNEPDIAVLTTQFILGLIYLILGFWSTKKPMIALLLALLVYLTTIIITGVFDPSTIYKGILWKVLIIAFIGKGLFSASSFSRSK